MLYSDFIVTLPNGNTYEVYSTYSHQQAITLAKIEDRTQLLLPNQMSDLYVVKKPVTEFLEKYELN